MTDTHPSPTDTLGSRGVAKSIVLRVISRVGCYRETDLVDELERAMGTAGTTTAYGVHIGDLNYALAHPEYVDILCEGTCLYADGNSVRIVARAFGRRLPERLVTTDVIWPVLASAASHGHPVFLIGGQQGLAEAAAETMRERLTDLDIVGCHHGYFDDDAAPRVADCVKRTGAHLVIVALGVPQQQRFCNGFGARTGARLLLTAGGLYGYLAGQERRAPTQLRATGMEWAWRVLQNPRRLGGRYARGVLTVAQLMSAALRCRGG